MRTWDGWSHSEIETAKWLGKANSGRLKRGKDENKVIRARIAAARIAGDEQRADMIGLRLWKKSIAFTKTQRLRQMAEQERDLRRVGAAVRRRMRELERVRDSATTPLFEFEPARTGTKLRDARDLYWEWIPRGFSKGKPKDIKRSSKPRIRAREAKWQDGEFEDKIVYIERADALEDVAGNLISNMGADQAERLGCASRIEELERLSRINSGVYTHCILALPADLSPGARATVLKDICEYYGRLNLPYCAALHKPDPKNSQRNFHAHILVGLRPMERKQDRWEFASTKLTWLSTTAGLKLQRRVIAGVFNAALTAEKSKTTFTARSRAADGLPPGGFTKRGGSRTTVVVDNDSSDVLHAREALAVAEALDGALGALQRTAERLEGCEQRLDDLEAIARAQTPSRSVDPVTRPTETAQTVSDIQMEGDGEVANSQRGHERAPSDDGREPQRSFSDPEELEPPDALSVDESPSLQRPYVPFPPPSDLRLRRRKLRNVRAALAKGENWQQLGVDTRHQIEQDLDAVIESLASGTVVISRAGELMRISSSAYDDLTPFEGVANSQLGWDALELMAEEISELSPEHHTAFEMQPKRPIDDQVTHWRDNSIER